MKNIMGNISNTIRFMASSVFYDLVKCVLHKVMRIIIPLQLYFHEVFDI